MLTAMETIKHIIDNNSVSKASIWDVNAEKEYHEEKGNN